MAGLSACLNRRDRPTSVAPPLSGEGAANVSPTALKRVAAVQSRFHPAGRFWSVAFWLCVAALLTGIGIAIGDSLQSPLLGFLGADFVFLVAVSLVMSGRERH